MDVIGASGRKRGVRGGWAAASGVNDPETCGVQADVVLRVVDRERDILDPQSHASAVISRSNPKARPASSRRHGLALANEKVKVAVVVGRSKAASHYT